eukprot:4619389-Pleurochrysis_carterae.AAC.1
MAGRPARHTNSLGSRRSYPQAKRVSAPLCSLLVTLDKVALITGPAKAPQEHAFDPAAVACLSSPRDLVSASLKVLRLRSKCSTHA